MTVVVCKKYKNRIDLASDSQMSGHFRKVTVPGPTADVSKIWRGNDQILGFAGSARDASYMIIYAKTHKPQSATADDVLSYILEFLDWAKKKNSTFDWESECIIIYEKKAFTVTSLTFVTEIRDYNTLGSGGDYALAALYLGMNVKKAVEVAKELDPYCSGDTQLLSKTFKL